MESNINTEKEAGVSPTVLIPDLSEAVWYKRFVDHFGPDAAQLRPVPQTWFKFWLASLRLDSDRGLALARKLTKTIEELLEDSMTTMQELVLSGDVDNVDYQIRREIDRMSTDSERTFDLGAHNSLMQFAVLTGNVAMVRKLLDKGGAGLLNKPDLVTSFSALHFAFFVQDRRMIELLLRLGANIDQVDAFFGTPLDYARMLRILPPGYMRHNRNDKLLRSTPVSAASEHPDGKRESGADQLADMRRVHPRTSADVSAGTACVSDASAAAVDGSGASSTASVAADVQQSLHRLSLTPSDKASSSPAASRLLGVSTLQVFNRETGVIDHWPIERFESTFGVEFAPFLLCDEVYIEELMFSGFTIGSVDTEFRQKYFPQIYESSGDENLVLAFVSDSVGYGVFAAKDFVEGDYIVRYGGSLVAAAALEDRSYTMASGVEGVGLDARKHRNLAGMINHSSTAFNAESQCVFDRGAEQAVIIAVKPIARGQQVLIDYSKNYWNKKTLKSIQLEDLSNIAALPI
eukprot:TRINITY_DN8916_c0_g1_i2.p1 TRINITY_DN8916_c0_g1~~TRINITY_DN8916_c0_g1_i2.p1  ORF type:complete len:519 (+),score=160.91 TRINITY_DN8916_c0_g1_i2:685-2241(+)